VPTLMPEDGALTITPFDIDCSKHFFNAFDHSETETSANWLVRFCQSMGGWCPFTRAELEAFYAQKFKDGFSFNHLEEGVHYVITRDRRRKSSPPAYRLTTEFVFACYQASPKRVRA
jgi:hypothetical protein